MLKLRKKSQIPQLPKGWISTSLGALCLKFQYGWTTASINSGEIKLLRTSDISSGLLDWSKVPFCETVPNDIEKYQLQQFDILISRVGAGVGLSYFLKDPINIQAVFASYLIRLKPLNSLLSKYIDYYLKSSYYWNQITNFTSGIAQPNINASKLERLIIPLPPYEELKRILSKLDKLFYEIEMLNKKSIKILDLEEKAFNKFLYKGTALFPSVKLEEFCTEKTERIGKKWKGKPLIGVSTTEGITVLRSGNKKDFEKYKIVNPQDLVYNPMRIDIGSIALWEGDEVALTSPDYVVFSISEDISVLFLLKYLKGNLGLSEINNNTQGSVRSRLYFRNLINIDIPYCGVAGQRKAQIVLENFKGLTRQSQEIEKKMLSVKESILKKAFEGSLVKQNKTPQSSTLLFKEIEKEKELFLKSEIENVSNSIVMKNKKEVLPLIDFISKTFKQKRFTFEDLKSEASGRYDLFKDELYSLLDKKIVMDFDIKKEIMYFKIK